jgi:hypothetical protein
MSSIEDLSNNYNYLDDILNLFDDIYNKCPCQTCIDLSTEKILSFVATIQKFYYFIIDNKYFIKQNELYLKKIKELLPNMITFNNVIIKDIVLINTQIGVSVIYLEYDENENENNSVNCNNTYTIDTLLHYYPELRSEFMS